MQCVDGPTKLQQVLFRAVRRAAEKRRQGLQTPNIPQSQPRLRSWREGVRVAPNLLLRTALWNIRNSHDGRARLSGELLPATDRTIRVVQNGPELRQADLRSFLQVLHIARGRDLGDWMEFNPNQFIQETRLATSRVNGNHKQRLLESLARLSETEITVRFTRLEADVTLPLLAGFDPQIRADVQQSAPWRVALDPKMALFFGDDSCTFLDWGRHLQLPTGLPSWLHGYLASHSEPWPIKMTTLLRASGSRTASPSKFSQLLRIAIEDLKRTRFLIYGEVRSGVLYVVRTPSKSTSTIEVDRATFEVADVAP